MEPDTRRRGSGSTTRQLLEGPPEFYFVVHTSAMVAHVRWLQRKHDIRSDIRVIRLDNLSTVIRGLSVMILVDHAAEEVMTEADRELILDHNSKISSGSP